MFDLFGKRRAHIAAAGAVLTALLSVAQPAGAATGATILVNSTGNTLTASDASCTLAEAITNANTGSDTTGGDCAAGTKGLDTITFNFGGGSQTIDTSAGNGQLPQITGPVHIDGTTTSALVIDCNHAGLAGLDLSATAKGSIVEGVHIVNCNTALNIAAPSTIVRGSWFGTSDGATAAGNTTGITVNASAVRIGALDSTGDMAGNLISGNTTGITIASGAGTLIQGNRIGTDEDGLNALPNVIGIGVNAGSGALIGGAKPGLGNVISSNTSEGISIQAGVKGTKIYRNFFGVGIDGKTMVGASRQDTIQDVGGIGTIIGGAMQTTGNLFAGTQTSIAAQGDAKVTVAGNIFGHTADGGSLANQWSLVLNGTAQHFPTVAVKNNLFGPNINVGLDIEGPAAFTGSMNCLEGASFGLMMNDSGAPITFTKNWWGVPTGPDTAGAATTTSGTSPITAAPFLTTPPAACMGYQPARVTKDPAVVPLSTKVTKFSWGKVPSANDYGFTLSDGVTTSVNDATTTGKTYDFSLAPLGYGTYFWTTTTKTSDGYAWVSPQHTFYVTIMKSPAPGATVKAGTVKFTWGKFSPTPADYGWNAYSDSACTVNDSNVTPNSVGEGPAGYAQTATVSGSGKHYWQVGVNSGATQMPCWEYDVP